MAAQIETQKQIGALPFRKKGKTTEVLLITSRETRRWVIPKGWPMKAKRDWNAAAVEASEEAGISGRVGHKSIGTYHYLKRKKSGDIDCEVSVYLLEVTRERREWPEKSERRRKWFKAEEAAQRVDEAGLQAIIAATLV